MHAGPNVRDQKELRDLAGPVLQGDHVSGHLHFPPHDRIEFLGHLARAVIQGGQQLPTHLDGVLRDTRRADPRSIARIDQDGAGARRERKPAADDEQAELEGFPGNRESAVRLWHLTGSSPFGGTRQ